MRALLTKHGLLIVVCVGVAGVAAGADLKDPTRPPAAAAPSHHAAAHAALPRVTAIFLSPARQVAIFNEQPVRVGDQVGSYRIDAISAAGVHYTSAGHSAFAALATAAPAVPAVADRAAESPIGSKP